LKRFKSENFEVKNVRFGRSITGKDEIIEKIEQDRRNSIHDIDKDLNIDYKTVLNHLEKIE